MSLIHTKVAKRVGFLCFFFHHNMFFFSLLACCILFFTCEPPASKLASNQANQLTNELKLESLILMLVMMWNMLWFNIDICRRAYTHSNYVDYNSLGARSRNINMFHFESCSMKRQLLARMFYNNACRCDVMWSQKKWEWEKNILYSRMCSRLCSQVRFRKCVIWVGCKLIHELLEFLLFSRKR